MQPLPSTLYLCRISPRCIICMTQAKPQNASAAYPQQEPLQAEKPLRFESLVRRWWTRPYVTHGQKYVCMNEVVSQATNAYFPRAVGNLTRKQVLTGLQQSVPLWIQGCAIAVN